MENEKKKWLVIFSSSGSESIYNVVYIYSGVNRAIISFQVIRKILRRMLKLSLRNHLLSLRDSKPSSLLTRSQDALWMSHVFEKQALYWFLSNIFWRTHYWVYQTQYRCSVNKTLQRINVFKKQHHKVVSRIAFSRNLLF